MTIKEQHDFILYRLKKERVGFVSHETIDMVLDTCSINEHNRILGLTAEYSAGIPWPRVKRGASRVADNMLSEFKTISPLTSSGAGVVTTRATTGLISAAYLDSSQAQPRQIDILFEDEWVTRFTSQVIPPSAVRPIAMLFSGGIQLYPEAATSVKIIHYARPAKPFYSYSVVGRTETHNPGASTNMNWGFESITAINEAAIAMISARQEDQLGASFAMAQKDKSA